MERLIQGMKHYIHTVHQSERELFEGLSRSQKPSTCFITCSDSRIIPSLITQTQPGEIFILRNAGNIIPPYGDPQRRRRRFHRVRRREARRQTHRHLRPLRLRRDARRREPRDLQRAAPGRAVAALRRDRPHIISQHSELEPESKVRVATKLNVLSQLMHLHTHPSVAARLSAGELDLHGWFYDIPSGHVLAYDPTKATSCRWKKKPPPCAPSPATCAASSNTSTPSSSGRLAQINESPNPVSPALLSRSRPTWG